MCTSTTTTLGGATGVGAGGARGGRTRMCLTWNIGM